MTSTAKVYSIGGIPLVSIPKKGQIKDRITEEIARQAEKVIVISAGDAKIRGIKRGNLAYRFAWPHLLYNGYYSCTIENKKTLFVPPQTN